MFNSDPAPHRVSAEQPPRVRRVQLSFDDVPRLWFADNLFATHLVNGLSLVFPAGERFFIRSVHHYLDQIDDPALKERIRGFFGQEAQHGRQHERTFEMLEAQGFDVKSFLTWYEHIAYEKIEPFFSPTIRLSVTAAAEHFTASLAEVALDTSGDRLLNQAHPAMRDLLRWHAAEEIEHKSVAFDVFEAVDGRYSVRVFGFVLSGGLLLWFWRRGSAHLLRQDPDLSRERLRRDRRAFRKQRRPLALLKALFAYLKPGFHPDDIDNRGAAERFLAGFQPDEATPAVPAN